MCAAAYVVNNVEIAYCKCFEALIKNIAIYSTSVQIRGLGKGVSGGFRN